MGFIKNWASKATGADVAGDAAERGAEEQAKAIRDSAAKAAAAASESAAQAARTQEQAAARTAAEGAASDALSKPLENADVQIGGVNDGTTSAAGLSRKRRQTFGVGSASSGVNI